MVRKMSDNRVQLRPMDFSLLSELTEGRNLAANLHMDLDAARPYVNSRLTLLEDYGLVDRVGPNPNAGLYEITDLGQAALENRDEYYDENTDFEALIESEVKKDGS